jgi:hypothetical protein
LLLFVTVLFLSDLLIGRALGYFQSTTKENTAAKINYIFDSAREEIIILGSSRAENHFNPLIIKNQTGLTCFNAGVGGQGLFFSMVELDELTKRYTPQHVILELSPNVLIEKDNDEKLSVLLPYFKRNNLVFDKFFKNNLTNKIKLISSIYPYNSMIIGYFYYGIKNKEFNKTGFSSLNGHINPKLIQSNRFKKYKPNLEELVAISKKCKEKSIRLTLIISPIYKADSTTIDIIDQIRVFCDQKINRPFIDYSRNSRFTNNDSLFYDNLHLNAVGSDVFTKIFASDFKKTINK